MNTTIKTVLENGKDFFKEMEELIYKVSGLEAELKNEKRLNFLQSEDVIRYGNELQKANETIKIQFERIQELQKEIESGKAPVESEQLKMAKRLFSVDYNIEEYSMLSYSSRLHYMKMAEEALKGA